MHRVEQLVGKPAGVAAEARKNSRTCDHARFSSRLAILEQIGGGKGGCSDFELCTESADHVCMVGKTLSAFEEVFDQRDERLALVRRDRPGIKADDRLALLVGRELADDLPGL